MKKLTDTNKMKIKLSDKIKHAASVLHDHQQHIISKENELIDYRTRCSELTESMAVEALKGFTDAICIDEEFTLTFDGFSSPAGIKIGMLNGPNKITMLDIGTYPRPYFTFCYEDIETFCYDILQVVYGDLAVTLEKFGLTRLCITHEAKKILGQGAVPIDTPLFSGSYSLQLGVLINTLNGFIEEVRCPPVKC